LSHYSLLSSSHSHFFLSHWYKSKS